MVLGMDYAGPNLQYRHPMDPTDTYIDVYLD